MTYRLKLALLSLVILTASSGFLPVASADEWNKETVVTFSAPVEVPGQVLPAGTYVFKLLDSQSDRNIVQIFSEDSTQLLATIIGVPDYRLEPADKTIITFEERAGEGPKAVRSWFYPGDSYGIEFVYPKQPTQVAGNPTQAVQEVPPPVVAKAPPKANSAPPESSGSSDTLAEAPEPQAETATVEEQREAQVTAEEAASQPSDSLPESLPATASNLALLPLMGTGLLGVGAALRRVAGRRG